MTASDDERAVWACSDRPAPMSTGSESGGATRGDEAPVTSLVLPVYNERENVQSVVGETLHTFDDDSNNDLSPFQPVEVILVNDGSTDGSGDVLDELSRTQPSVTSIHLRRNFGQSAALAAGIDHASGDYVVTLDADGQNNPSDIPALLERLTEGYDCVSGWRRQRRDPLRKRIPSRLQTWIAFMTGPDIHDFGCTLKAYRRGALDDVDLYGESHRYIPAQLYKHGYRITELEVDHRQRTHGSTKYSWGRLVKGFVDLLFHMFWNRYSTRPLHVLGGVGFFILTLGWLIGVHTLALNYLFDLQLSARLPRLILSVALILFGLQMVMFGFLAEMLIKQHYRDQAPYRVERIED